MKKWYHQKEKTTKVSEGFVVWYCSGVELNLLVQCERLQHTATTSSWEAESRGENFSDESKFMRRLAGWVFSSYSALLEDRATALQHEEVLGWFDGREAFSAFHQAYFEDVYSTDNENFKSLQDFGSLFAEATSSHHMCL